MLRQGFQIQLGFLRRWERRKSYQRGMPQANSKTPGTGRECDSGPGGHVDEDGSCRKWCDLLMLRTTGAERRSEAS